MELNGLVAVVTGAARGIGYAIAERFVTEGARVALWDINAEVSAAAERLGSPRRGSHDGAGAVGLQVDVTDGAAVSKAVSDTAGRFGRIDVLVNNAGILGTGPIAAISVEAFERVLRVNVTGTFICCRAVVPIMTGQGHGKIVNIASLAARTARPVAVNYAASKAAVVGLTQTLARELGPAGIYVNAIAPGPILTDLTKQLGPEEFASLNEGRAVRRDGTPADVADAAVFLASARSNWVTGVTLDVNGGILIR
jgi:NAD(P)-dependent dehydrogenase (short-subunit alcohol dehydrogenase family)